MKKLSKSGKWGYSQFNFNVMNVEMVTKEDLQELRIQLLNDIKEVLSSRPKPNKEWLKSKEVRKILKISAGTLQNLRITGKLKYTKIGGIHYYPYSGIERLLDSDHD